MKHTRYFLAALAALLFVTSAFAAEKEAPKISDPGFDAALTDPSTAWANPSYKKDIPATQAQSRPVSTGWKLWMKHHEQRKSWVKEREVDLLMVGDSIVFGWGRTGRKVCLTACTLTKKDTVHGQKPWNLRSRSCWQSNAITPTFSPRSPHPKKANF